MASPCRGRVILLRDTQFDRSNVHSDVSGHSHISHDGSMERLYIYLHGWLVFDGINVGRYTIISMDPMGI